MIGRKPHSQSDDAEGAPQGFDDFALRLGDVMRGERATLGKSLLDVQRELRIKASYIAAIENCDPSAFDTPGFIAGYVRSYARYLGMDPDEAFAGFCRESGFSVAHGMSQHASVIRKPADDATSKPRARNPLAEPRMPFAPKSDSLFSRIEPGAIGSSLVLMALIGGIGYGGWAVLQEVQRVQVTPVDQTPVVLSELDPLDAAVLPNADPVPLDEADVAGVFTPPTTEAFDRLYRPQALDVPVLVARDAPISTLDPDSGGAFAGLGSRMPNVQDSTLAAAALAEGLIDRQTSQRLLPAGASSGVTVVAARPAWVEIAEEDGTVLLSRVLNAGENFAVPRGAADPHIQVGESGAVFFTVDGQTFGPAGARGTLTEGVALSASELTARYEAAAPETDADLALALVALDLETRDAPPQTQVARAAPAPLPEGVTAPPQGRRTAAIAQPPAPPQVLADLPPGITVVATAETWVEVTAPSGKKLFAQTLQPGQSYQVPQTDQPATIFSGNAGGVFFAVDGQTYGPYGQTGQFGRDLALAPEAIKQQLQVADLSANQTLARVVAELRLNQPQR